MDEEGFSIRNLTFSYPAYGNMIEMPVLNEVGYELEAGTCAVVLAPADGGKTTLARVIAGLLPRFSGGRIMGDIAYRGTDLRAQKPYETVGLLGAVFQDSDEQIFTTRCDTEVAFALESMGIPREEMRFRVHDALKLMGLIDFSARSPATLSGGEKKRLLIACLVAADPELWILDEAFEELDRVWKRTIVRHLRDNAKTALFFDSRWSPMYASCCTTFSVLRGGRLAHTTTVRDKEFDAALDAEGLLIPTERRSWIDDAREGRPFLLAEKIRFSFPGSESFSLQIGSLLLRQGAVCSLVGKNGSGKSTLGRILCGVLKPDEGSVRIHEGSGDLSRKVGYLFQNPDYQIFLPTVFDELAYGLYLRGTGKREVGERVEEAIRIFSLPAGDTSPSLMSYGARKRLQAATYFLLERGFLILDEMDSGLSYREFFSILEALAHSGAGILVVTHDLDLARAISYRILLIEKGTITADLPRSAFGSLETAMDGGA
jgi:energy-coupling factor transport system ATP-binding protein